MRVAHLSDLHFGTKNLAEAQRCTEAAVAELQRRQAQCVVISGDATDHAVAAHTPAFAALVHIVRAIADYCPVLLLQGTFSHEPPGTLNVFRLLGGHYEVFVADHITQVVLTTAGRWLSSDGPYWTAALPADAGLVLSCLPTVNKANVAAALGADEADWATGDHIAAALAGFAPFNEVARAAGVPTLGVSHGTVNGCVTEYGQALAGLDHEFSTGALFGAHADAFLLGHIHRHQRWSDSGQTIAYAGSIGRYTYGEQGEKGWLLWNIAAGEAECELITTPAQRTLEVTFESVPTPQDLEQLAATADGARVRVRWTVGEDERDRADRVAIEAALRQAGAVDVLLEARVLPRAVTRSAGIAADPSVEGKLTTWATVNAKDGPALAACLTQLHRSDPEAIATQILLGDSAHLAATDASPKSATSDQLTMAWEL